MYFALTLWKVPTTPRLKIDQKPSNRVGMDRGPGKSVMSYLRGVRNLPRHRSAWSAMNRLYSSPLSAFRAGIVVHGYAAHRHARLCLPRTVEQFRQQAHERDELQGAL